MRRLLALSLAFLLSFLAAPEAQACACGCGVFSVGTSALLPQGPGGMAFLEYDYMDQNENWSGTSSAPAAADPDKDIRTDFYTVGLQYMVNRAWGVNVEVPYWDRLFVTTTGSGVTGFHHDALGDVRLTALYTGFSDDLSTGLVFGLKLPTGDYTYPNLDRDTSIGSGSTDTLLGGYHQGSLDAENTWSWFVQAQWQRAFATRDGYRPGNELDAALGAYYAGWGFGRGTTLAPVLQLKLADRRRDSGVNANTPNSGYTRVLVAPGLELDSGKFKLYTDVEFPIYQDVNGNQLVAPRLYKFIVSVGF